jgi:hypothetical protein
MNTDDNDALKDTTFHVEIEQLLAAAWPDALSSAQLFARSQLAESVNAVSMSLSDKHRRGRVVRVAANPEIHGPRVQFAYQLSQAVLDQQRAGDESGATPGAGAGDGTDVAGAAIEPTLPPPVASAAPIEPPPADGRLEHWAIKGAQAQQAVDAAIAAATPAATAANRSPWRAQITAEAAAATAAKRPARRKAKAASNPKPAPAPESALPGASLAAAAAAARPASAFRCALWSDGTFEMEGLAPRPMVDGVMRLAAPEIRAVVAYLESFDRRDRASEVPA